MLYLRREDEKNMNKTTKVIMAALLMCMVLISVGSVMAKQQGDGKGDCDQSRDGSCDDTSCEPVGDQVPDQTRINYPWS